MKLFFKFVVLFFLVLCNSIGTIEGIKNVSGFGKEFYEQNAFELFEMEPIPIFQQSQQSIDEVVVRRSSYSLRVEQSRNLLLEKLTRTYPIPFFIHYFDNTHIVALPFQAPLFGQLFRFQLF